MSEISQQFDDEESQSPESGEVFMMTFAAVGGLTLLEMERASASLPMARLSVDEAQALLSGAPPPNATSFALDPPAAGDAAFQAALAALRPPTADTSAPFTLPPADAAGSNLVAPYAFSSTMRDALCGDDALYSSTPQVFAPGPGAYSVRGDDLVISLASRATLFIGGEGDLVLTTAADTVHVLSGSSVTLAGSGAKVTLGSQDILSLMGSGFDVAAQGGDDIVFVGAHSQANIFGGGVTTELASDAAATVGGSGSVTLQAGSTVNLMDGSTLAAFGHGAAYLGANDYLSLFGAFDVFAPLAPGASALAGFGASDTLQLRTTFADIASLLGAASEMGNATILRLDSAGDALTLVGLDKAAVSSLALSGQIRLD
jgi:hypothetical protein